MSMKDSKEVLLERIKKLEYEMACMEATHKRQYEADFENYEATVKRQVASYKALNGEQQRRIDDLIKEMREEGIGSAGTLESIRDERDRHARYSKELAIALAESQRVNAVYESGECIPAEDLNLLYVDNRQKLWKAEDKIARRESQIIALKKENAKLTKVNKDQQELIWTLQNESLLEDTQKELTKTKEKLAETKEYVKLCVKSYNLLCQEFFDPDGAKTDGKKPMKSKLLAGHPGDFIVYSDSEEEEEEEEEADSPVPMSLAKKPASKKRKSAAKKPTTAKKAGTTTAKKAIATTTAKKPIATTTAPSSAFKPIATTTAPSSAFKPIVAETKNDSPVDSPEDINLEDVKYTNEIDDADGFILFTDDA